MVTDLDICYDHLSDLVIGHGLEAVLIALARHVQDWRDDPILPASDTVRAEAYGLVRLLESGLPAARAIDWDAAHGT